MNGGQKRPAAGTITTQKNSSSTGSNNHRFRRCSRLTGSADFGRVFEKAARSRDKMFTVLSRENGDGPARLGLAISKKHCRLAVGRNRLKRIVRESFRQHKTTLAGLDIVVMNQPAAQRANNRALFDSLSQHWQRCCEDGRSNTPRG